MNNSDMARKIVGDNSRLGRSKSDFYPTPKNATQLFLTKEQFNGNIWECACGKGDISNVLIEAGYSVKSSDINDYGYGEAGIDFLNAGGIFSDTFDIQDNIVTNPPFNLAVDFIKQSKLYSKHKIAMFLKTSFLEGVERYELFQDKVFPLKCMYQFSRRVNFGKNEGTHKNGGMIAFAWFVWERNYTGKPTIDWLF
jgi:hypothetical protein